MILFLTIKNRTLSPPFFERKAPEILAKKLTYGAILHKKAGDGIRTHKKQTDTSYK